MAPEPPVSAAPVINAMSVDVEDWFQVSAFERHISREDWDGIAPRVEDNTRRVLDLFAAAQVQATFFTLGWVARRFPALVRAIVDGGHELASHGMAHVRVTQQSPEAFRADAGDARKLLEDTGGCAVRGYRAASFSIGRDNLWALDVLTELGYDYSSSIFPVRHDLYGMHEAPRFRYREAGRLLEVPPTTVRLGGNNLPCAGGGYFRLLPYAYFRWGIGRVNRVERQPAVFYFHPWEIDPGQPRQHAAPLKTRLRHYTNLHRMAGRLRRLLSDFAWSRMDRVFLSHGSDGSAGGETVGRHAA